MEKEERKKINDRKGKRNNNDQNKKGKGQNYLIISPDKNNRK